MNSIETHSYKTWTIEIYEKQPGNFSYHCYGANGEEWESEGYNQLHYAVEAAQKCVDERTVNSTGTQTKEVGSPTEDDASPIEDLNDL